VDIYILRSTLNVMPS